MELVSGEFTTGGAVAILPSGFHAPTIVHLGLAEAALDRGESVLFVLPRAFPHKRLGLLKALTAGQPRFAVAITDGGLFAVHRRNSHGMTFPQPVFVAPLRMANPGDTSCRHKFTKTSTRSIPCRGLIPETFATGDCGWDDAAFATPSLLSAECVRESPRNAAQLPPAYAHCRPAARSAS